MLINLKSYKYKNQKEKIHNNENERLFHVSLSGDCNIIVAGLLQLQR